ncbi:hypothetical protein PC116_g21326 [Phytophthora cactorum]|uniref:Secreted protein n=1 Tax=Phytophthora cactorum TaxID=29920 RepID=A0A8T1D8H2_9STRA|nr:hypothetical protein PC112_g17211 [Phytophthora cactorum]KAG2809453.1 hypothetical protein PC111_g16049 [Phytophthora cactorum]KAG2849956.1 hypothetical protein PC113_g17225 [Phytophthora cactorum]KAG2887744.1 hypothetical protein PC114_g18697 [Phytophthora cactorum]KAG2899271.1 hypothetical protein PC115_g16577 [Phytophthora cactorum]
MNHLCVLAWVWLAVLNTNRLAERKEVSLLEGSKGNGVESSKALRATSTRNAGKLRIRLIGSQSFLLWRAPATVGGSSLCLSNLEAASIPILTPYFNALTNKHKISQ